MDHAAYLILGGGVAGTTAAEEIRARDAVGRIVIIDEEPHRFYSRIMLSKPEFFLGSVPFDRVFLKSEEWYRQKRIDLSAGKTVERVDPSAKRVMLRDGTSMTYDKLLLATGACAAPWNVSGTDKTGVYNLRTLDDAKRLIAALPTIRQAVLIGGGFISFETCELLKRRGITTTVIIREPYYWANLLDVPSGTMIEHTLERSGVRMVRKALVATVEGTDRVTGIRLENGQRIACDTIIVGIGSVCVLSYLEGTAIALDRGVKTNAYLETSVPNIWAAGDVASYEDEILEERVQMTNWANAQMQGRLAGRNMTGGHEPFRMVSFYTTQALGLTIAFVGDVRVDAGKEVITRRPADGAWYVRLIVQEDELVGATLLNRTGDIAAIRKLIEDDVKVPPIAQKLGDPTVPLASLTTPVKSR